MDRTDTPSAAPAGLIDVKRLIRSYSLQELNETAEAYYQTLADQSASLASLLRKPFHLPSIQHLLAELGHLIYGLDLLPGDRVLDFGCGIGWTSRILNACGCAVVGVDVSMTAIRMAGELMQRWRDAGLLDQEGACPMEFRHFDGLRMDLPDASFDKIFVLDAFHHVPDQALILAEFARVLKPGGVVGMCEAGPNHSRHPESQRAMALHKVIENDIVLEEIEAMAHAVGLGGLRVCISPLLPMVADFASYRNFPNDSDSVQRFLAQTDFRVKNYPIFFLQKTGAPSVDSRGTRGLCASMELRSAADISRPPGSPIDIAMRITNTGSATWLPSAGKHGAVNIGYSIQSGSVSSPYRAHLSSNSIEPGQQVDVSFRLPPLEVGRHTLVVDLVAEQVAWFETLGGKSLTVCIDILPR